MKRTDAVIEAAQEALAILEGNHPGGAFAHPEETAAETIRTALVAYHSPQVADGGYAWDNTIAGILIYDGDGRIAVHVKAQHVPQDQREREALIHNVAALLDLATFRKAA